MWQPSALTVSHPDRQFRNFPLSRLSRLDFPVISWGHFREVNQMRFSKLGFNFCLFLFLLLQGLDIYIRCTRGLTKGRTRVVPFDPIKLNLDSSETIISFESSTFQFRLSPSRVVFSSQLLSEEAFWQPFRKEVEAH